MINLENTKLVLFDFDDTLCIHKKHGNNSENEKKYYREVLRFGAKAWSNCDKSPHMQKFMNMCRKKHIPMGLISTTGSYKHAEAKHDWVFEQYGIDLDNYCVGTYEGKLTMTLAIAEVYDIPKEQILIVDDFWENLERAANNGFNACTPMEIVNFIEKLSSGTIKLGVSR